MRTVEMLRTGLAAVILVGTAAAQTTPSTPSTPASTTTTTTTAFTTMACTTATTSPLQSFAVERTLPLTSFNSSFTPTFPPNVQSGVTSNALEIREGVSYNAANQLLTLNLF